VSALTIRSSRSEAGRHDCEGWGVLANPLQKQEGFLRVSSMSPLHRALTGLGLARQLVCRANRARDRKAYAKAAKFYALALTLHPERTDLRVQWAIC
jgi:hypothetical protein